MKKLIALSLTGLITAAGLLPLMVSADEPVAETEYEVTGGEAEYMDRAPALDELRRMALPPFKYAGERVITNEEVPNILMPDRLKDSINVDAPLSQGAFPPAPGVSPPAILSFGGYDQFDNADLFGFGVAPPDTEGDVGLTHYVQWNNLGFKIFLKDGTLVNGPYGDAGNLPWLGMPHPCGFENDGDPIVLYDHVAGRWFFSQFEIHYGGWQCVAVTDGEDPAGPYTRYAFRIARANFNDYPKIGLWVTEPGPGRQSTYVVTTNEFNCGPYGFCGVNVTALNRDAILAAAPANYRQFFLPLSFPNPGRDAYSLQPGHLEGPVLPPAATCAPLVMAFDDETWGNPAGSGPDGYRHWLFCPDFRPARFGLAIEMPFTPTPFDFDANLCDFGPCVYQPNGWPLDTLSQFTMYRYAVRHLDSAGGLTGVVSHTIDLGLNLAGVQWVKFDFIPIPFFGIPLINDIGQLNTGLTDGLHRWMPSVAQDAEGNMGLGYTVANDSKFASVYFAGRELTDPPGTLRQESVCIDGTGAQSGTTRWGDYSTVSIDPADDCTFWVTNEYVELTGNFLWDTQVCTFKFPGCGLIPAPIDIIFCRNPNYFICPSKGDKNWTEATIFGTADLDVSLIDLATVQVCLASDPVASCTTTQVRSSYFDRGDPTTDLGAFYCAMNPKSGREERFLNQDGIMDLQIGFKNSDLLAMPAWVCPLGKEEPTGTFIIKGLMLDGTPFESMPVDDVGIDQLLNQAAKVK